MVNINKIKELAKSKGIKIGFICSELGFTNTYLNDIEKGKSKKIHPDTIHKIARILGTTYDYLTDLTDDPDPNYAAKKMVKINNQSFVEPKEITLNVEKTKNLAKTKGTKIGFLCNELGFSRTYLNDVAKSGGKAISPDTIHKIARILGTTYDYLTDLTDDPDPNYAAKNAESPDERLIHKFITLVPQLSPEQMGTMEQILDSSEEELDRILSVVKAMRNN